MLSSPWQLYTPSGEFKIDDKRLTNFFTTLGVGLVPILLTSRIAPPFVSAINIQLPKGVWRKESIQDYIKRASSPTSRLPEPKLQITMLRTIGTRTVDAPISTLQPLKPRRGRLSNLTWLDPTTKKREYAFVGEAWQGSRGTPFPGLWDGIWEEVKKRPVIQ